MKAKTNLLLIPLITVTCLLGALSARGAVTLTVSPASITNDFTGKVTLTITGLTNNQQVLLQRYYDVNTNGVIDAGDLLSQSFKLTDGQLPLLGGVRNQNVPGDDDGATNGQIQTKLDYPGLNSVVGGSTGNFIYKVVDQNGAQLATQLFSVKQKVLVSGVHGQATLTGVGSPLTNVPVALVNIVGSGNPTLAITDTNGNYTFYAPGGSYSVIVAGTGYVSDENANFVTIPTNQNIPKNISVSTSAMSISGTLTDVSNGKPLGQVFVNGESTNNLFAGTFTDTNGNYSFPVTASKWKVKPDKGCVAEKGYLSPQNNSQVTVSNSSVANVNFTLPKATALIYGTLKTSSSNAIAGIGMSASDDQGLYQAYGLTSSNGSYSLGVVAGNWNPGADGNALAALGYSSSAGTNVTMSDGQSLETDFVLQGVTAHLRGQVQDNQGHAITNIQIVVQPYPLQGNGSGSIYPVTDTNGNFDAGVYAGTWNIALECVSAQMRGYVDVSGFNFTVNNGVDQNGIILVFPQATAVISGIITDTHGNPISGISVNANQAINSTNSYFPGCVNTDSGGHYQIQVLVGTWMVSVGNQELEQLGYQDVSPTNITISGGTATANFVASAALASPQFGSSSYSSSGGVTLHISGTVGHTNTVQYSSNLVTWVTLTNTILNNSNWQVTDPATNQQRRFYRAFVSP